MGRNMRQEPGGENCEAYCLLVGSAWLAHPTFYTSRAMCPGMMAPFTVGWVLPHQCSVKKMFYVLPISDLIAFSHLRFFFINISSYCKVDQKPASAGMDITSVIRALP